MTLRNARCNDKDNTNYVTKLGTHSSQQKFIFYLRARSIAFRHVTGYYASHVRFCNWLQPQPWNLPDIVCTDVAQFERYCAVLSTYKRNA